MMSGSNYQTIKQHQFTYKRTGFQKTIIKENGGSTFLGTGGSGIDMGLRKELYATDKRLTGKDGNVISDLVGAREE